MELVVDRDIAGADEVFGDLGTVRLVDGRRLGAADLGAAEVLLVRSVTRVDRALLEGSAVRFVGTTTAGTDHVDLDWLDAAGIRFASAPGCNARAVAEHVACCLVQWCAERGRALERLCIGIIGYGHVGRALGALLDALGIRYLVNDPPLGSAIAGVTTAKLADLAACDVLTVHTPLTHGGAYPTAGLIDHALIARLRPGTLVINAARGGILDETALCERRDAIDAALDCWQGEPHVAPAVAHAVWRGTPHIAGHTLEARIRATVMVYQELCAWLGRDAGEPALQPPAVPLLDGARPLPGLLETCYPLAAHSARMRALAALEGDARVVAFDAARRAGLRREFASHAVACARCGPDTVARLRALGFAVEAAAQ